MFNFESNWCSSGTVVVFSPLGNVDPKSLRIREKLNSSVIGMSMYTGVPSVDYPNSSCSM